MDTVYLVGSEEVQRAGSAMHQAATEMTRAASVIQDALYQHERFLENWLVQFKELIRELSTVHEIQRTPTL